MKTNNVDKKNIASVNIQTKQLFNNLIEDEKLLTKEEIAQFLNVSVKMIDKRVHMNSIPYFKIGRLVRFSKSRILAWAEGNNSSR